jgi:hypothetical protein
MNSSNKLITVKIIHTLIWTFFNIVIFYLLYAVLSNTIDQWVWLCLGAILLEGIVLLMFNKVCPVTLVARRYSKSQKANFDIYLPEWLARYNKQIYSAIVLAIVIILAYRILMN